MKRKEKVESIIDGKLYPGLMVYETDFIIFSDSVLQDIKALVIRGDNIDEIKEKIYPVACTSSLAYGSIATLFTKDVSELIEREWMDLLRFKPTMRDMLDRDAGFQRA